jgi:hypothetical protein
MLPLRKRLLDQVRDWLRLKNYAYRTEKSYLYWIEQIILFHDKHHPVEMSRHLKSPRLRIPVDVCVMQFNPYSYLKASTGSRFAARVAG